jgi:hypothetical protein
VVAAILFAFGFAFAAGGPGLDPFTVFVAGMRVRTTGFVAEHAIDSSGFTLIARHFVKLHGMGKDA